MLGQADAQIDTYVAVFERAALARAMDRGLSLAPFGELLDSFGWMPSWRNRGDGVSFSPKLRAGFERLAAAWPDEPTFACLKSGYAPEDTASDLLARVLDLLPAAASGKSEARIVRLADLTLARMTDPPPAHRDADSRIARAAKRVATDTAWDRAMWMYARGGMKEAALDAMRRLREALGPGASQDERQAVERGRPRSAQRRRASGEGRSRSPAGITPSSRTA